jgi:hypothetical protein
VLFHLNEAHEKPTRTIRHLRETSDYDYGDFMPAMQHLYHHLNTAWNATDASPKAVQAVGDKDFRDWSAFPTDLPMFE